MSSKPTLEALSPKLDAMARCIDRIESKKPFSKETLTQDFDLQDIVSVNLERAVQQAIDIATLVISYSQYPVPGNMADSFLVLERLGAITAETRLRMVKATGFRNLAVHEYDKINWNIVHDIVHVRLDDLRRFSQEIVRFVSSGA